MLDCPEHLRLPAGASAQEVRAPEIPVPVPSADGALLAELARARDLLARWEIVHLRVHFRCEEEIVVPFAGSLLRGGFGASLHRLACVRKDLPCGDCILRGHCIYPALFEPEGRGGLDPAGGSPVPRRGPRARLFAIVPPERISKGPGTFDLKLIGPPPGPLPYLIYSLVEMGRAGIGHELIPLHVTRIESLGPLGREAQEVFDPRRGLFPERVLRFTARDIFDGAPPGAAPRGEARRIVLHLRTPLRMKEAGRIRSGLTPERLVRASLRRLIDLGEALGQSWPRDWPGVLGAGGRATSVGGSVRWFEWGRFSRRQGRAMRLGGALGAVELAGVPGGLVALLRTAAFLHLGKNTTFGLGAIELEEVP